MRVTYLSSDKARSEMTGASSKYHADVKHCGSFKEMQAFENDVGSGLYRPSPLRSESINPRLSSSAATGDHSSLTNVATPL